MTLETSKTRMKDVKSLVTVFVQQGTYCPTHQGKSFGKELALMLLEKHKLAEHMKPVAKDFMTNFKALDQEVTLLISKLPSRDDWHGVSQILETTMENLRNSLITRLNTKLLQELDVYFDCLATAFKSWAQVPSKSQLIETFAVSDSIWEWCEHKDPEASGGLWIPPSKMSRIRQALLHQLTSPDELTTSFSSSKTRSNAEGVPMRKFWVSPPPSRWVQAAGSNAATKLGQVVALERLLMGCLRIIASSNLEKFGFGIDLEGKVMNIYKKSIRFVESFVVSS